MVRGMADKLLNVRGVTTKVGVNWFPAFLERHPGLKSKYSRALDQERYLAEDPKLYKTGLRFMLLLKQNTVFWMKIPIISTRKVL